MTFLIMTVRPGIYFSVSGQFYCPDVVKEYYFKSFFESSEFSFFFKIYFETLILGEVSMKIKCVSLYKYLYSDRQTEGVQFRVKI